MLLSQGTPVDRKATGPVAGESAALADELEKYSCGELLQLGNNALEEYDYERCEACFCRAVTVSKGDLPAARAFLEFMVDNLAAYDRVVELAETIGAGTRKNKTIKALIALDDPKLRAEFDQAVIAARQQQQQDEIDTVSALWQEQGSCLETLAAYVALLPEQQQRVAVENQDVCFVWLDQLMAAHPYLKPQKAAEVVLALGRANDIVAAGQDPSSALAALQPVHELAHTFPAGVDLIRLVDMAVQRNERVQNDALVQAAQRCMHENDLMETRIYLDQVKNGLLNPGQNELVREIAAWLKKQEHKVALKAKYVEAVSLADNFAARDAAGHLSSLTTVNHGRIKEKNIARLFAKSGW